MHENLVFQKKFPLGKCSINKKSYYYILFTQRGKKTLSETQFSLVTRGKPRFPPGYPIIIPFSFFPPSTVILNVFHFAFAFMRYPLQHLFIYGYHVIKIELSNCNSDSNTVGRRRVSRDWNLYSDWSQTLNYYLLNMRRNFKMFFLVYFGLYKKLFFFSLFCFFLNTL